MHWYQMWENCNPWLVNVSRAELPCNYPLGRWYRSRQLMQPAVVVFHLYLFVTKIGRSTLHTSEDMDA